MYSFGWNDHRGCWGDSDLGPNRSARHWKRFQQQFVSLALSAAYNHVHINILLNMFHWWYIFIFAQDVYTLLHIFATVRIMIPWNFSFKITIEENPVKYLQTFMQSIYFATHVSTFSDNSDGKERSLKYFWTEWDLEEICFCQTMCSRPLVIAYWCQVNIFLPFSSTADFDSFQA